MKFVPVRVAYQSGPNSITNWNMEHIFGPALSPIHIRVRTKCSNMVQSLLGGPPLARHPVVCLVRKLNP